MKKETLQAFCLSLQGATHDYQPEWQANRYHIGGKMFAMMGGDVDRKPVITLKCDPQRSEELREMHEGIIPGYYMNKTHWNSIYLDADIPSSFVEELIEHSYQLVFHKLTKKAQQAILQHDSKETD
ncbi:MmcQ/YjbR family DNA-binding protein [Bacillus altitudinis]|uniref:MmcQ/YjbR family DNA-binding protein n=1 Tax=Bacillus altitudinis TaxID=293387 RepID=UPI002DBD6D61|nr:MmcQ/YjbR family DNA-binding protein [Bacillus altitudinis]MEC2039024.1 MmcQ/YjbR family DNA-binding protein [Bacillus altitudinis]